MKKIRLLLTVSIVIVSALMMGSSASANPKGAIHCAIPMSVDFHDGSPFPYWKGDVLGCELEGTIRFDVDPSIPKKFPGNTYHFYELFTIYPDSGGYISGTNAGMVTFSNWKFLANGVVTDASPEWDHLIGSRFHENGTIDPPGLAIPGYALDTTMIITPGK